jgi:hypothetical protein
MAKSKQYYIRKSHRYLGVFLGIQFLLWTIGGMYFSWSNMDEIHGDTTKKKTPSFASNIKLISPSVVIDSIRTFHPIDSLVTIQLIEVLNKPTYQIKCIRNHQDTSSHVDMQHIMNHLADAETGKIREPLSEEESIEVAKKHFNGNEKIKLVEYITTTNAHHEYRENPLPAYAVTFNNKAETTVYVSTELGTVQKFRNNKWRIFDFLWMMHTMNYEDRDKFGNIALRSFSILGLITIISGFWLFFNTQKKKI